MYNWYYCPECFEWTPSPAGVQNPACWKGCANQSTHQCKFTKQIPMLTKVIGVCDCGKEKELDANEIDFKKQA